MRFHDETAARLLYSAAPHQPIGATHMTMSTMRRVGDRVSIDHPKYPGVWVIKSIARVNATLVPENGPGRPLRCNLSMLGEPGADVTPPTQVTSLFDLGEFVRIETGKWAGLWVVISDKGADRVNLAKAGGGDGQRYLRAVRRDLVRLDPQDVLKD